MNYGPLEFAAYLRRKQGLQHDSAAVEAARAASPAPRPGSNRLTIVAGGHGSSDAAALTRVEAVSVYEAVSTRKPGVTPAMRPVRVQVRSTARPLVLVLSSHQTVEWEVALEPGAALAAVLLSGYGQSTVRGAGSARISSIGGFYAFRRGSAEYRHLECEVRRCTGRRIETFQSVHAGSRFEVGSEMGSGPIF